MEDRSCIWRIEVVFERSKLYLRETSCIWMKQVVSEREREGEREECIRSYNLRLCTEWMFCKHLPL